MPEEPESKLTVLWATDGSASALSAIPLLRDTILPVAARLVVLTVAPHAMLGGARPDPAFLSRVTRSARTRALTEARKLAENNATILDPDVPVEVVTRWGHPIEEIIRAAKAAKADIVIMGAQGHSNLRIVLLGSVTQGVAQHSARPLLITRPGAAAVRTIVVGYDGSAVSRKTVAFLERLAVPPDAQIVLSYVIEPFTAPPATPAAYRKQAMEEAHKLNEQWHRDANRTLSLLAGRMRAAGRNVETEVLTGAAAPELDATARRRNADLIVVGSRKPSPSGHYLLGSTAEKLVRHSHTSVLVVR